MMGDYHTIGAQRDRAKTWSYLDRIASALERIADHREPGDLLTDDLVDYLHALQDEGCTYTTIGKLTGNPDVPVVVYHDGDTCPIHETDA